MSSLTLMAIASACIALFGAFSTYISLTFTKKQRQDISWLRILNGKKPLIYILGVLVLFAGTGFEIVYYYRNPPLLSLRIGPQDQGFVATTSYVFDDEVRAAPEANRKKTKDTYFEADKAFVADQYGEAERLYKQSISYYPTLSAYLGLGISQGAESHYRDAEASFEAGLALQGKHNAPQLTGEFLANNASILRAEGRSRDSEEAASRAVDISGRSGRSITRAIALTDLGNIYADRGKPDTARDEYDSALAIYSDIHDHVGAGIVYNDLASLYLDKSKKELVKSYIDKARNEFQNSSKDALGLANTELIEGMLYSQSGTQDEDAMRSFSNAKSKAVSIGNRYLAAAASEDSADLYRIKGDYNQAISLSDAALNEFTSIDAPAGQANALMCLGNVAAAQSQSKEALDFFKKAESAFDASGNILGDISAAGNEAEILGATGKFGEAEAVNQRVLRAFESIGNKAGEANTLLSLGNIYLEQRPPLPLMSLKKYREALSIATIDGDQGYIAKAHTSIGNSLMMVNKFADAEKELQTALNMFDYVDDPRTQTTTIIILGELRLKERKYCDARNLFDQAMKGANKQGYGNLIAALKEDQGRLGNFCKASGK
jgi:tetratricopeptide (TPR) repeat protein